MEILKAEGYLILVLLRIKLLHMRTEGWNLTQKPIIELYIKYCASVNVTTVEVGSFDFKDKRAMIQSEIYFGYRGKKYLKQFSPIKEDDYPSLALPMFQPKEKYSRLSLRLNTGLLLMKATVAFCPRLGQILDRSEKS